MSKANYAQSWTRSLLFNIFYSIHLVHNTTFKDQKQATVILWSFPRSLLCHCPPFIHSFSGLTSRVTLFLQAISPFSPTFLLTTLQSNHRYFMESQSSGEVILSCLMSYRPLGKSWLLMIWWHRTLVMSWPALIYWYQMGMERISSVGMSRENLCDEGWRLHSHFSSCKCPHSPWDRRYSLP